MEQITKQVYELKPRYDSRKSFYGKAKMVGHYNEHNEFVVSLYSYNTLVAYVIPNKKAVVLGTYSQTTLRHIKEFLKQHGYKAETKSQIENNYMKV